MPTVPRLGSGIPLVARSAEITRLRAALARADQGQAGAVLVSGDAGVGKTRLLTDLAATAEQAGALVLIGRCVGSGAGLPYLPFADVLAQLRGDRPEALHSRPALARLLPDLAVKPLSREDDAELGQLQLFDAVHSLLAELSAERTVLLTVEDVHWADSSSRNLLTFLLSRLSSQRLLVAVTYRADELHRRHPLRPVLAELVRLSAVERLDLTPFNASDATAFVRALADDDLTDVQVQRIAERSEGNAFFAEELLASSVDCGCDDPGVPTALADVLLARIERLSPAAQQVLRAASAGGRRVQYARLHEVAGMAPPELEDALREAVQHNVLVDVNEHYAFRHALLREAIYTDLLPGERVRLHAAYAQLIKTEPGMRGNAAKLAYHSMESHDLPQALAASVQAASEADDAGAPSEALHYTEQALKIWPAVADPESHAGVTEVKLTKMASMFAISAGELERGIAFARQAVRISTDDAKIESLRRLALAVANLDGREQEAAGVIDEAWELVHDQPESVNRAWVMAVRARMMRAVCRPGARAAAEDALNSAVQTGSRSAEADVLITVAVMDEKDGLVDDACSRLIIARDRAIEAGALNVELRAWFNLGVNRYEQGLIGEAVKVFSEGLRRSEKNGLSWSPSGFQLRALLAVARYVAGDWAGSAEAARLPGDPVANLGTAIVAASGLPTEVGAGRLDQAELLLQRLRPEWRRDFQLPLFCTAAAVELHGWRGRPDLALAAAEDGIDTLESIEPGLTGVIHLAALGVSAAADLARRDRRRRDPETSVLDSAARFADLGSLAAKSRPRSGKLGPEGLAWQLRLAAEITRLDDGTGDPQAWRRVVDAFGYGHSYERALARWRLAAALLADDARDEAAQQLRLAAESADRLGAIPLSAALSDLARRSRIQLGDAVPRDTVDLLTPRERSVLSLVALGRTNREVGEELYISEKTVSVHLSRIMAKLGASRRAEAVATAYDRGLLES
ncbi:LuxR family transcriptional regulator [Kutzneria sp. 744]|uniref:helix-turn-helix transcriptional regulator n=1 Tax=Kutzneria sp. (strain 744) TaxID=345341 RepID=UPI0003EED02D|nr:LuxR family transcriptional regulator [Kutzneria sp. 744]EWM16697.1 LuxR-family transcriptional regulator [Kutzneria sp. 744]